MFLQPTHARARARTFHGCYTHTRAGRKYLAAPDLRGKVFVTAGLGGMSGAQAKAAVICGAVGIVAEVGLLAGGGGGGGVGVLVVCVPNNVLLPLNVHQLIAVDGWLAG